MSPKGNDILRICLGIAMIIFAILGTVGIIPDVSVKRTPVVYVIAVGMIIWGWSGFRGRKKAAEKAELVQALSGKAGEARKPKPLAAKQSAAGPAAGEAPEAEALAEAALEEESAGEGEEK